MSIIQRVLVDALASRKKISRETGIPESTVQRHLKRLKDSGVLKVKMTLSSQNRFYPARSIIGIDVSSELKSFEYGYENQQEFVSFLMWGVNQFPKFANTMANVLTERVEVVLGGPHDIVVILSAVSVAALSDYTTMVLRQLPGVLKTDTASIVSYDSSIWRLKNAKLIKNLKNP